MRSDEQRERRDGNRAMTKRRGESRDNGWQTTDENQQPRDVRRGIGHQLLLPKPSPCSNLQASSTADPIRSLAVSPHPHPSPPVQIISPGVDTRPQFIRAGIWMRPVCGRAGEWAGCKTYPGRGVKHTLLAGGVSERRGVVLATRRCPS